MCPDTTAPPRPRGNPYRSLRGQMFVVLIGFGLIPVIAMGITGAMESRKAMETRMRGALESMVKNRKVTVELFLETTRSQLALVAASTTVKQLSDARVLEALRGQMRSSRGAILDLGLIADNGRHVAYSGPYKLLGLDYSGQRWFQQAMVLGHDESDIFLGLRRFPHMTVAVKKQEAGRDWILRATIDTDLLSELVREGGLESGADVFVLNRAGEYQTRYSDSHRLMEKADLDPIPLHSGLRVVERTHRGRRELLATCWLRGDAWVLVARQPVPELSALLDAHPWVTGLAVVLLIAVPPLSYVVARHRLRQIRGLEAERETLYESIAQSQKMAAIGRLAAGVAHEINNPLAIIQAQVGVLSDVVAESSALPNAVEFKERIAKIEAQVERGRKVTHRLLGFSRRVGPELEPVDVAAALDETVSFVEKELGACRIAIVRDYGADVPIVRSSLAQLQQVFLNLINNALDAIGQDGELRLGVHAAGEEVLVTVGDTGPGIPAKDLDRIFEPFFSSKSTDKRHTGLGLAICQDIMRTLGGRITVESAPGQGAVFSLWVPRSTERA